MEKAMRIGTGIACISVLVLCTGAVPAEKKSLRQEKGNKL